MNLKELIDRIFGFDVFISYSHKDGIEFVAKLSTQLESSPQTIRTFLDRKDFIGGDQLPEETIKKIKMSSAFIVVAGPKALQSKWVALECETATTLGKRIIIINRCKNFDTQPLYPVRIFLTDILRIKEETFNNIPSKATITAIKRWFQVTRKASIRLFIAITTIFVLGLLMAGTLLFYLRSETEKRFAESRGMAAEAERQFVLQPHLINESTRLGLAALAKEPTFEAQQSIRKTLNLLPKDSISIFDKDTFALSGIAFGPKDSLFALAGHQNEIWIFDLINQVEIQHLKHSNRVSSIAINHDGNLLASAGIFAPYQTLIWDIRTGKVIMVLPHSANIWKISWHPEKNWLATACFDGKVRIWDITNNKYPIKILVYKNTVWSVSFSKDGNHLVIATGDSQQGVVELVNWKEETIIYTTSIAGNVTTVSIDDKLTFMSAGNTRGFIWVWDLKKKELLWSKQVMGGAIINSVDVLNLENRQLLATGSWDKTARIWGLKTGNELMRVPFQEKVDEVSFSRTGNLLASCSYDGKAILCFPETGNYEKKVRLNVRPTHVQYTHDESEFIYSSLEKEFGLGSFIGEVDTNLVLDSSPYDRAFTNNSNQNRIARSISKKEVLVLDLLEKKEYSLYAEPVNGKHNRMFKLFFSNSSQWIAGSTNDGNIYVWDIVNGNLLWKDWNNSKNRSISWTEKDAFFLNVKNDTTLAMINPENWSVAAEYSFPFKISQIIASSIDNIIGISMREKVIFYTLEEFTLKESFTVKMEEGISMLKFSNTGNFAFIGGYDGGYLIDTKDWEIIMTISNLGEIDLVDFSKNNELLACVTEKTTCTVWSIPKAKMEHQFRCPTKINGIDFHPSGKYLLTACMDQHIYEWGLSNDNLVKDALERLNWY